MKLAKLYNIIYFEGESTRTISKHLQLDSAMKYANIFLENISNNYKNTIIATTVSIGDIPEDNFTLLSLTLKNHTPLHEGIIIKLKEQQTNDNDTYTGKPISSSTDSGHVTTARHHGSMMYDDTYE